MLMIYARIYALLYYTNYLQNILLSFVINMTLLFTILEKHAPLRTRIVTLRPHAPWYTNDTRELKSVCPKLKRHWRHSCLASDYQSYVDQRLVVKEIIFKSKLEYYSNLISGATSDNKALFRSIDRLLPRKPEKCLSSCCSAGVLANQFVTFFENKIDKIRSRLEVPETTELFRRFNESSLNCKMDTRFSPTSITELLLSQY